MVVLDSTWSLLMIYEDDHYVQSEVHFVCEHVTRVTDNRVATDQKMVRRVISLRLENFILIPLKNEILKKSQG